MWAAFFLICSLNASSAEFLFKKGEERVYSYSGKIISGIPELDNTYAGLSIECDVVLRAVEGSDGNNKLIIK